MQSDEIRKTRLVLSAPHSVAETWLPHKLALLLAAEDYTPIDVRIDDDPIDMVREKIVSLPWSRLVFINGTTKRQDR